MDFPSLTPSGQTEKVTEVEMAQEAEMARAVVPVRVAVVSDALAAAVSRAGGPAIPSWFRSWE